MSATDKRLFRYNLEIKRPEEIFNRQKTREKSPIRKNLRDRLPSQDPSKMLVPLVDLKKSSIDKNI